MFPLDMYLLEQYRTTQVSLQRSHASFPSSPLRCLLRTYLQSFQFLVDASEFQSSIHAATSIQEGKDCYEEFVSIINEYIKDNSNSEINIDSRTKTQILRFEGRSSYASLDMVRDGV